MFVLQVVVVAALFLLWFSSESIRDSKSLWIFVLYALPSNFIAATVPHDPAVVYFAKFYPPLYVTAVGIASVVAVEAMNFSVLRFAASTTPFARIGHGRLASKILRLFGKAPCTALCLAGFLPVPFYPLRFVVALSRYPLANYLLAVVAGRGSRIYVLCLVGHVVMIPDYVIFSIFTVLVLVMYGSLLASWLKQKQ